MDKGILKSIKLDLIRENPVALRSVNRSSEEYMGLVDSIRTQGVLNPIVVREVVDTESNEKFYMLIDGLHRFCASQDAGHDDIPCNVLTRSDAEVLAVQIIANVHKVETRPVEYSRQLVRLLSYDPLLTTAELATKLGKSPAWIGERLGLLKLDESIASLVDDGKINLTNAYALAKLPKEEQGEFIDSAMNMSPAEFVPVATNRAKEIRDARRQGRNAADIGFVAIPRLQKLSVLKEELDNPQRLRALIVENNISDPIEAAKMTLQFVLNLDPKSVEAGKAKYDAQKQAKEEAKKKRQEERAKQRAEEAATTAIEAKEDADRIASGVDPEIVIKERKAKRDAKKKEAAAAATSGSDE